MTTKNPSNNVPVSRRFFKFASGLLLVATLAVCLMCSSGCGILGAAYGIFIDPLIPPPTIKSEHDLTQKHLLIWVEDSANSPMAPQLKRQITQQLTHWLIKHKALKSAVEYSKIVDYRYAHPDYPQLPISQIAKSFQADEVLTINITGFALHHETQTEFYQPRIAGTLSIISSETGDRIWPVMLNQRTFEAIGPLTPGPDEHIEQNLIDDLCDGLAQQLAMYFYDHPGKKN